MFNSETVNTCRGSIAGQTVYRTAFGEGNRANLESHGASDYISGMAGDGDDRFPSTVRLKKKAEFIRVFREGVTWKGSCFSVHVLRRDAKTADSPESGPRLGLVVSRKVGSAVERNRIKRKLREAFRKNANRLPAVDLVILPDASCATASEAEIVEGLERAIKRALRDAKE